MSVEFIRAEVAELTETHLERVRQAARASPRGRARICLHHGYADGVQEMVVGFTRHSYAPPHRHAPGRSESFQVIEGSFLVVIFDEAGHIHRGIAMTRPEAGGTFIYRLSAPLWHTVVPIAELSIIHEISQGPFVEGGDDLTDWAPPASDVTGGMQFLDARVAAWRAA
ncbi:MAG: cupin fold metalloprotein, WbuC family [Magnetococcales bacterium]|nr:cupin fold metalloprotein, WbuC family [Magnetococcales bacterium]